LLQVFSLVKGCSVVADDDRSLVTRRERVRAATVEEIKTTARSLLVDEGPESVTLRAIAREMGMTAPALYRYFDSHDALLRAVVADIYDELADALEKVRDRLPEDDPGGRLLAMSREFREWGVRHQREFGLVFATPISGGLDVPSPLDKAGSRFGAAFIEAFFQLFKARPFPVPADDQLSFALRDQLEDYRNVLCDQIGDKVRHIPLGAFDAFLRCWVQLYGFVALEVFEHLTFALVDAEPAFESNLAYMAAQLGVEVVDTVRDDHEDDDTARRAE
jgi:AcrR family transcriptional regulator